MYKNVLQIEFDIDARIREAVKIRHDIVHRNGKNIKGEQVILNNQDIVAIIDLAEILIRDIEGKLNCNSIESDDPNF